MPAAGIFPTRPVKLSGIRRPQGELGQNRPFPVKSTKSDRFRTFFSTVFSSRGGEELQKILLSNPPDGQLQLIKIKSPDVVEDKSVLL